MTSVRHMDIMIFGRVQKVGYRYFARKKAEELGITGSVRNLPDGRVSIQAEGNADALAVFIGWCKTGPSLATVDEVICGEGPLQHYTVFEIM